MKWTADEIKENRMSRNLGYKAMGKRLGLQESKYRRIELGLQKPGKKVKEKLDELWEKWLELPKAEYGLKDAHSEKQKETLRELGLHKLIR